MMRYRVIPFVCEGVQMFTLVQEWSEGGKVVRDSRQQMTKEQFYQLQTAVLSVKDTKPKPKKPRRQMSARALENIRAAGAYRKEHGNSPAKPEKK